MVSKKSVAAEENAMNFIFSPLTLPEPPQFQPNNLVELARNLGSSGNFTSLEKLKDFRIPPARNINEILADIQQNQANKLSRLEWVYCIQAKKLWDQEHPEHRMATSQAIWEEAAQDSWLSGLLLWHLTLYHSGQPEPMLAPTLAECFSIFGSCTNNQKLLPVRIIEALTQDQPDYVAMIACGRRLTPRELLNSAKLPQGIPLVQKALDCVAGQFAKLKPPHEQQVEWLLCCLDEMSLKQQVSAVNDLLTQVPTKVGGSFPKLVAWLRRYYGKGVLSKQAQKALREWIGAVN